MAINTIIEKINELKKNYITVEFEGLPFDTEYVNEVTLTCSEEDAKAIEELNAELEAMAAEKRCHANVYDYWFDCEDGESYEVSIYVNILEDEE